MANDKSWEKIFKDYKINKHNFVRDGAFTLNANQIKISCQNFKKTTEKEVRILCKQDSPVFSIGTPQKFLRTILYNSACSSSIFNIIDFVYFDSGKVYVISYIL